MKKQHRSLINASQFYESIRENDFSVVNGIGEIVDNAIESGATHISINVDSSIKKGMRRETVDEITITDDGCGMDEYIISKCLVLGESIRIKKWGRPRIGKFGFGLVAGGTSIARHIDVYSRVSGDTDFLYTYIDLDEIKEEVMVEIPEPVVRNPNQSSMDLLDGKSGTVIVISKCDRMDGFGIKKNLDEQNGQIPTFIGRTYRKFIAGGTEITYNGKKVFLHDPLYLDGPTMFDSKEHQDPRARIISQKVIDYEIPNSDGQTAPIKITITLLPIEWRRRPGDGGRAEAKKRKIDQNEGISILRADREVLYDTIPRLIGTRGGQVDSEKIDRFWGCEISFPPELDECFKVRYIKRGAEPIGALKDRIRDEISLTIKGLRETISSDWAQTEADENLALGVYENAERTMANISQILPNSKKGSNLSEEDEDRTLDELVEDLLLGAEKEPSTEKERKEKREEKKKEIRKKPYSIQAIKMPLPTLFEPVYLMEKVVIKININHPFYIYVIKSLLGELSDDEETNERRNKNARIKDAIMLLLLSYAKAEAFFPENEDLFVNLRTQWAIGLSAAVKELYGGALDGII